MSTTFTSKHAFTAGPAKVRGRTVMNAHGVKIATATVHSGAKNFKTDAEAEANANLIAEAFNVAHETGLTPRQLAERCKELEGVLARSAIAVAELCNGQHPDTECWNILREVNAAIAKTGGAA